jgi:hypothetical protein
MKTIENLTEEFNKRFSHLVELEIENKENFEKIKAYFIWNYFNQ